jgi:hypothetical protein
MYTWRVHVASTPGKHTWQAHLASTPGKHTGAARHQAGMRAASPRARAARCGAARTFAASSLSSRNAYAPFRSIRSDLRPQRVKARNTFWLRSLGRTMQLAASRAWHGAMRVLSSAR